MKAIKNKHNYYLRSILIIIVLACSLIVPFIVFFPEGLLFGVPTFLVLLRLFIYVNITQQILVESAFVTITSYKLFFFRKMIIPSSGVEFRLVTTRFRNRLSHSLEVIKDGKIIYEVFGSEGFSEDELQKLAEK